MPEGRLQSVAALLDRLALAETTAAQLALWREIQRLAAAAAAALAPPASSPASGVTLTITGDPIAQLSPNLRINRFERARRVAAWRSHARLAWLAGEQRQCLVRARVDILIRRGRPADPDNALAALKAVIDGLCARPHQRGLLRGDSERDIIYGEIRQETGSQWRGREAVVLCVIPVPAQGDTCEATWG